MRLHGLDIARFLAFVGMVLVNFRAVANSDEGQDYATLITHAIEGRAAALFVVLAGVGLTLSHAPAGLLLRRAAFLFVIGILNMLIFDADILHYYALYFLVGIAYLNASDRGLLLGATTIMALSLFALVTLDYSQGWDWDSLEYEIFWTFEGFLLHSLFNGWHPVLPWAAFILFGMWLGRRPLDRPGAQWHMLIWGSVVSALAAIPGMLVQSTEMHELFGVYPIPPWPFYVLAGAGSATAMIGAVLLLTPSLQRLHLAEWLAAPGRQALTLYVAHIMLGMGVMEAMGWIDGGLAPGAVFWGSLGFCALAVLYARVWTRFARRGPLEWLLHLVTEPRRAQKRS